MFLGSFFTKKNNKNMINQSENYLNKLLPSYIDNTNPKYLLIDDMYFAHLMVVNYSRNQTNLIFNKLISSNNNMNISMFYEKLDSYKVIRDLTYYIGNTNVNIKENNSNAQDIDNMVSTLEDARYIRKQLQVDKEELFYLYLYISIFDIDKEKLEKSINEIEAIALSLGLFTRRANFRQQQVFNSILPFMQNNLDVKEITRRNILTSSLASTYPFILSQVNDENGVLFGINKNNNSMVIVDIFNDIKYKNANICIFGASGSGKSYFTKLLILRNKYLNIEQLVIDPEREYIKLCNSVGGAVIKIGPNYDTYINVLDIRQESIDFKEEKRVFRE